MNDVAVGNGRVDIGDLIVVERNSALLYKTARLAVRSADTRRDEHRNNRRVFDLYVFFGKVAAAAAERRACLSLRRRRLLFAVNELGELVREHFLSLINALVVEFDEPVYLFERQES